MTREAGKGSGRRKTVAPKEVVDANWKALEASWKKAREEREKKKNEQ